MATFLNAVKGKANEAFTLTRKGVLAVFVGYVYRSSRHRAQDAFEM